MNDVRDFMVGVFPGELEPIARIAVVATGARVLQSWREHGVYVPVVAYRADREGVRAALAQIGETWPLPSSPSLSDAALLCGWMPMSPGLKGPVARQLAKVADDPAAPELFTAWERYAQYWYQSKSSAATATGMARRRLKASVSAGVS